MTIKKWILFFLLTPFIYFFSGCAIFIPVLLISAEIYKMLNPTIDLWLSIPFFNFFLCLPFILSPFILYLCAKIFGLFNYIDKLKIKFVLKPLLVFAISIPLFLLANLFCLIFGVFDSDSLLLFCNFFFLIPLFFIYKFFQFLTKKFPVPFETLAYYFSVEFYKSIVNKLFKKIKNKLT